MPIKRLLNAEYFPIDKINNSSRLRQVDAETTKHYEELAESLKLFGPITPLTLDDKDNLIAGGCRLEAYKLLGETEVPIVRRAKLTPKQKRILEVEENVRRKDMNWQDIVLGILEIHEDESIKAKSKEMDWGMRMTGKMIGQPLSYVHDAITVARFIRGKDKEILAAKTLSEAKRILTERKLDAVTKVRASRISSATPIPVSTTPVISPSASSGIMSIHIGPPSAGIVVDTTKPKPTIDTSIAHHIDLSKIIFKGDNKAIMANFPEASIPLIITDIPYGIDMTNLEDVHGVDMMKSTHQVEENIEQMKPFLEAAYRVLEPDSNLLFFFALQHFEKLRDWGKEVGFKVCDWPILWLKPHSSKNNVPQYNPTKSYEPLMVMRKGKGRLHTPIIKSHFECDGTADRKIQSNPFAKPLEFFKWLMPHFAHPGDTILDPYAGEGSILRAAIVQGYKPLGIEISEERFPALISRMQTVFKNTLGPNTTFSI